MPRLMMSWWMESNTTDISALDYAIYAPATEVTGKKQFSLPICLKNQNSIATWQADLVLPEGFSVATDSNGNPKVTVSGSRTTASRHSVVAETLPSGAMHLLYSSSNNSEITGTDGEVATITINIAYDLEEDDYAITFKDIVMTEANETGHEQSQVVSLLTVAPEDPSRYDHNGDGKVTIEDVTLIINYIKTHENLEITK